MNSIYLDNAATSFPKPEATYTAMEKYSREIGANPGRSGHGLSIDAGRIIYDTREALSRLFHIEDPLRIALTKNATEALNIALLGLLHPGDHVITTSMEHNSVMRPLRWLESQGIRLTTVPCSPRGELDPDDIPRAFQKNTRLVVMTHASNVTGTIMPVAEAGRIVREKSDALLCVDAAQTAGVVPIDVETMNIDLLAFTGHKSLYGPQGTGGLYIRGGLDKKIAPLMRGGTGSRSEFEEQPDFMPDKYESGTPNTVGYAGLCAGVVFVLNQSVAMIRQKELDLTTRFLKTLNELRDRIMIYGPENPSDQTSVISFNIRRKTPSEAALFFEEEYGILCRPGLHCAPAAHHTIGTAPQGTVRFSFGFFTSEADVDAAAAAVCSLDAKGN